ncbi:MAG TPA: formylglycine-generating enzyme family protein [Pyrinomonadaceae bacterium]|nr:formylglycine-generating enzyme family protein [Pyrinomonadaceae bacterium]
MMDKSDHSRAPKSHLALIGLTVLALAGISIAAWYYFGRVETTRANGHNHPAQPSTNKPANAANAPPVIDRSAPSGPAPEGMVWIPAGEFSMGTEEEGFPDTRPIHRVKLNGFWMDKTEITNAQFEKFVKATGYVTIAERKPRAEDFPNVPPEKLVAGSIVFTPPRDAVPLNNYLQWWAYVAGASWRHPEGPQSDIKGRENYPVVHISHDDAQAYAKWAGKRLPTEAEFEWAARGGLDRKKFVWGDEFKPDGKFQANSFQGNFPNKNTGEDGYMASAPVGTFRPNEFGLYDVAGNVWEWCSDWYRADYYQALWAQGTITLSPQGPSNSSDPSEPGIAKRVTKGGSFLCTDQYCARYMPGGRGKEAPDTGTNHLGFRLVRSVN